MRHEEMAQLIYDIISNFKLSENAIFHIMELADRYKAAGKLGTDERLEARENLRGFLSRLSETELQELMCLMDFGRELSYYGFCKGTVDGFIENLETNNFANIQGEREVNYVAGKVPLGDWLRLVLAEFRYRNSADDFYRLTFYKAGTGARDRDMDYPNDAEAWAALCDALCADAPDKYSCITLVGHSLKGRAETHMATVNLG